ncbi:MAG: serine hydrolase [Cytophagales bacterium]|nr:serine hydrolase [Cytophagales bacterium]
MRKYLQLGLIIIGFSCGQQPVQEYTTPDAIDELMSYCHETGLFNGTILVAKGEEIIYRNAFGIANYEKNELLTPETAFYLASVSKQFTTTGIMILKERGLLSYDDPLSRFFPDFPDYGKAVTIRQMMNHTSGIPDHYGLGAYKKDLKNQDVYTLLTQQESLNFPSGDKYSYSNGGYVLLAMIIEQVSGQPLHVFMKENIFDPLEMNNTLVYDESKPEISPRAIGYFPSGDLNDYEILTTGAGGMYSNVDDLHQWHLGLFTEKIVSQSALMDAYAPTALNDGEISNYGLGWGVDVEENSVQHSGGLNGFRTFIKRFLDTQEVYIMLTNHGDAFRLDEISTALDNILKGKPYTLPKGPLSYHLKKLFATFTVDEAISNARAMKDNDDVEADENGINALGLQYLRSKEFPKAIAVLELNTELFPYSFNTFDSYGEALLKSGDTVRGIENYRRSIELNPNNEIGIKVLIGLGLSREELVPEVLIDPKVLESYTGDYELRQDFFLTVIHTNEQMFIQATDQDPIEVFAYSENRFYAKVINAQVEFNQDDSGKITSLTLFQRGEYEAPKVN